LSCGVFYFEPPCSYTLSSALLLRQLVRLRVCLVYWTDSCERITCLHDGLRECVDDGLSNELHHQLQLLQQNIASTLQQQVHYQTRCSLLCLLEPDMVPV